MVPARAATAHHLPRPKQFCVDDLRPSKNCDASKSTTYAISMLETAKPGLGHDSTEAGRPRAEGFVFEETTLRTDTPTRNGLLNLSSDRHPGRPRSPRSVFRYEFL